MVIPVGLNHEILENDIKEKYKNIRLNSKYQNGSTKVELICRIDDHKWQVFPRDIYDTHISCSDCNRRNANLTLRNRFHSEYPTLKIITRDIFSNPKITIKCTECGEKFEVYRKHLIGDNIRNFNDPVDTSKIIFMRHKKNPLECSSCKINKIQKFFVEVAKERNVEIIGEYINNTTPVKVKCNKCGTEYSVVPIYYVNKLTSECKFCKKKKRGMTNV